ncbi:hypothetical protein [Sphingosinicella sp.]|uniref:hypothetical protein n=1 Tax=Sphingosinicella sp. TaxID=1917971 RepID=UPI002601E895|nr:hypothetical protein [Sphingosinicella sp.]MEA3539510.1 hypothetical protein [Pseudomonadota bacterium]
MARDASVRAAIDKMLADGASIDQITARLGPGAPTRSAIGRYAQAYRRLWSELETAHAMASGSGAQHSPSTPQIRAAQNAEAMLRILYERDSERIAADVRSNVPADREPRGASPETIESIYRMLGVNSLADAQRKR